MKRFIPVVLLFLFLLSCGQANLSVLVDPWWEDAWDTDGYLRRSVAINSIKSFNPISVYEADSGEKANQIINDETAKSDQSLFIVTPAFYSYIRDNEQTEKKINYIILNGFYDDPADNVIAVYSSREDVYFEAGVKSALFSASHGDSAVAAVFYDGSEERRRERDSFIKGFESAGVVGDLITFDQQTYSGGERLKNFINNAPDKGVGLFFFSASSLNPYCYELALPLSIPLSGENLNSLGIYNELIEFSVDDDIMEIVNTALKLGLDGEVESDFAISPLLREKGIHF